MLQLIFGHGLGTWLIYVSGFALALVMTLRDYSSEFSVPGFVYGALGVVTITLGLAGSAIFGKSFGYASYAMLAADVCARWICSVMFITTALQLLFLATSKMLDYLDRRQHEQRNGLQ